MIDALISAEAECTSRVDITPDKVLRPVGTVFKEWAECLNSTKIPYWIWWEVTGYVKKFRGCSGDVLHYERMEEVKSITERKE